MNDHLEREKEKEMAKRENKPNRISKPLDLTLSFLVPALSIGLLVLEFGLLFQHLDNLKAILLAVISVVFGMVLLIFAGRSINIINETTFYKLYTQLIKKIPLLSSFLNVDIKTRK